MAFKLGDKPYNFIEGGQIKKKFNQLNIVREDLAPGVMGEAIDENTISIDINVPEDSEAFKKAVAHEGHHAMEMKMNKIDYGDDYIRDGKKTYHRYTNNDGEDVIMYNGKEVQVGSNELPWEKRAVNAEKNV